jgi:hypothetical protein
VAHLSRLVDDLLDVSRIASGKVDLRRRPLEISEVVEKAVEIVGPLLEERRHELAVDVPAEGLAIDGDPVRLSQSFANLLTNAAKYTPHPGHVRVSAAREGDEVVVRVKDDGMGIPADLLPRMFDLFVQGHQGSDRAQGGLGLGLALVKSLIGLHGGSVAAHSEGVNRGSELTVRLPILSRRAGPGRRRRARSPLAAAATRVLVVEPMASRCCGGAAVGGHEVAIATTARRPCPCSESRRSTSASSIPLPVMDGYELARRIRQRRSPPPCARLR